MAEDIRIEPISPPLLLNAHGESRRVGFELELSGLELEQIARIIVKLYGGEIYRENQHKYRVSNTRFGTFRVELDFALLEGTDLQKYFEEIGIQEKGLKRSIENIITKLAKSVLPYEVISPPVSMDEIKAMDILREELNREKALGTKASIAYAFGLHINPETPSFQVEVILSYLRAFLLLYNWLKERVKVDFTRKITPFVYPFPEEYALLVLDSSYTHTLERATDDYIKYNRTRNRPLDMLPLLAFLDEERVFTSMNDSRIKPRPTFHYRLPNSQVDDADWRISEEWNRWAEVERLAFDEDKLALMSREYLDRKRSIYFEEDWVKRVEYWLD